MAITVECENCSKKYRLADDKAGSTIRCRDCGDKIRVPDDEDDFDEPMARPVRRKTGIAGKRRKKSNGSTGLILALVGGGSALFLVCGIVVIWMIVGRGKPQPAAAPGEHANAVPAANPGGGPLAGAPGATPPAANPGAASPIPATTSSWNVAADPPKNPVVWPETPPKLDGFRGQLSQLKFTSTRTPFAVSGIIGAGDYMRVWNLATGEVLGKFDRPKPQLSGTKSALSADGALIALIPSGKQDVELWSVAGGQLDKTMPVGTAKATIDYIESLPSNQLLLIETDRSSGSAVHRLAIVDLTTGKRTRDIVLPEGVQSEKVAISPGSRFAAIDHGHKEGLGLYDLSRGAAAGRIPPGEYTDSGSGSSGLRFSPDGSQLGVIGHSGGQTTVVVIDLATGKAKKAAAVQGTISSLSYSNSPPLQWLDDDRGWLLGGNVLLDSESGKAVWKVETEANKYGLENSRARIPVGSSLWSVDGPDNDGVLTAIEIPWDTIRERLGKLDDESNLLRPGAGISIVAEVGMVRFAEADAVKQELTQGIAGRLTSLGLVPGEGQPLVMRAVYSEAPGNTLQFSGLGRITGPKTSVESTQCNLELKLTDESGQTVYWSQKAGSNPYSMIMKGEPTPENVRKQSFDGVLSGLRNLGLPLYVSQNSDEQLPVLYPLPRW